MNDTSFFYDSIATYYDHIFPLQQPQIEFCLNHLGEKIEGKTVLDIGCGTGNLAVALTEKGATVTAIDPDGSMISCAGCKCEERPVEFIATDLEGLDKENNQYDLVTCFGNTIAHIAESELPTFFNKAKDLLKPNGTLAFQILNYEHILANKIDKLPEIDNKHIRFDRTYTFDNAPESIQFNTRLLIKSKYQYVDNSITLFPHTKQKLLDMLQTLGFDDIKSYGNFKQDKETGTQLPLIVTCKA